MTEQDSISRRVQGQIYRDGVYGRRPAAPTEPEALERAAGKKLGARAWAYLAGGAGAHRTARANLDAFDDWAIVPRMLVDTSTRDLTTELFGRTLPAPLLLAPIGVLELAHPRAELELADGVRDLGLPLVISTQGSTPMEETAEAMGDCPRWYQLYWSRSDELAESFVRRAEAIGSEAIVLTLDTQTVGWRTRDLDLGSLPFTRGEGIAQFTSDPVFRRLVDERVIAAADVPIPASPRPTAAAVASLLSMARHWPEGDLRAKLRSAHPRAAVETFLDVFSRPTLSWRDLARLRDLTRLPIVLKGIQHPEDAAKGLDHGADGIIVSNHGGRQVDGAIAAVRALPGVVERVGGRVPVLFDSGVRSGADVFKAIALGAAAVLVGRPYAYGLAIGGAAGARAVMEHFLAELDVTMALTGATSIEDIRRAGLEVTR